MNRRTFGSNQRLSSLPLLSFFFLFRGQSKTPRNGNGNGEGGIVFFFLSTFWRIKKKREKERERERGKQYDGLGKTFARYCSLIHETVLKERIYKKKLLFQLGSLFCFFVFSLAITGECCFSLLTRHTNDVGMPSHMACVTRY